MPRSFIEALAIAEWLLNKWEGKFQWDEFNVRKPLARAHTVAQVEKSFFTRGLEFIGEIQAYDTDKWKGTEQRYGVKTYISGKPFIITITIRGEYIRYISHRRFE